MQPDDEGFDGATWDQFSQQLPGGEISEAALSVDRLYRFELRRTLPQSTVEGYKLLFVMANPSTADHIIDDPTIRRCKGFARAWGFEHLIVANVNPYRTPRADQVVIPEERVLHTNDYFLDKLACEADYICCAWGAIAPASLVKRAWSIISDKPDKEIVALGLTKNGSPRHPLYIKADVRPVRIRPDLNKKQWQSVNG